MMVVKIDPNHPRERCFVVKVIILGTGGTIASDGAAGSGAVASRSAAELMAGVPGEYEVEARDLMTVGSYRLTLADMRAIALAANAAAAEPGVAGVVVTHGTDTMEETAYLTSLVHAGPEPVVFTGAQFAADAVSPDGARNLRDAVEFAADPGLRGAGTGIAFGGELLSARGTRKARTTDPQPFAGGTLLARRSGARIAVRASVRPEPERLLPGAGFDGLTVDMVMSYPGADTAFLEAAGARADAIVLVGTGVGNAAPGFAECVARLTSDGTPVILATRVADGPVTPVYGNGGGVDIVGAGAVPAGELSPQQARMLAAALLAAPDPAGASFAERFARHAS